MDPRILNLMFAVMSYVGSKASGKNPFVKGFREDEDGAVYENMVQALMDCEEFFPQVDAMVDIATAEEEAEAADREIEDYWNGQ